MKIFDRSDVLSAQAVPQIERITTATAIYVIESGADYAALPSDAQQSIAAREAAAASPAMTTEGPRDDGDSLIDYREFGSWLSPGQDVGANWQKVIDQLPAGASLRFGRGEWDFSDGALVRKRIGIVGSGFGTRLNFVPTVASETFLTFDGVNGSASEVTDELQLDGAVLRDFKLRSDRSIRAHALRFRRCDNVSMGNLFVNSFAGSSLVLENSREFSVFGFRTRFNGRIDSSDVHLSDPDWLWHGPPTFVASATSAITAGASATFSVSSTTYTDPGGVIIGLSVGASIVLDDLSANNRETVKITGISGLNVTVASVANSHASGCQVLITSDSTNYCQFHDVKLIFPFWHALVSDNTSSQTIAGIMIHMLPSGSTTNGYNLEGNVVRYFGGSRGFSGGVPNNIYAAIHSPVTGNETSVSGLKFKKNEFMWAAGVVARDSKKLRISDGVILGGGTNYLIHAEGNGVAAGSGYESYIGTEVSISNADVGGTNAFTDDITLFSQIGGTVSAVDVETGIVTLSFAGNMTVPPTGYPIVFKHATNDANLPAGATGYGQPMYCIRVSNTQMKVAHTRKLALAGLHAGLSSSGTGTSYVHFHSGCPIAAFNGAKVLLDTTVRLSDGMQPYTRDTWPGNPVGTAVIGLPTLEPSFSVQQVLPWVLSTLNMNTSAAGIQFGIRNTDGSQNEKLGFFGATPATKPASASQVEATDYATTLTLANSLRAALVSLGLIKGSA